MIHFNDPLAARIRKQMVREISHYQMLEAGDKVMVCVSGGKDSSILLALLSETKRCAPFPFDLEAVLLDQKQPGFNCDTYRRWIESEIGIKLTVLEQDTYSIVKEKSASKIFCSLCSRLRRGILYNYAAENKFTKLALGHHREDAAETLLLNLFYSGRLQAMPPKFKSDDGRNIVIRPLISVAENSLLELSEKWKIPIMPCNLCGSQDGLKRKLVKSHISELEKLIPDVRRSMATAITNVRASHLSDDRIWNFRNLAGNQTESLPFDADNALEDWTLR